MARFKQKQVCLLANLGGFEAKMEENLELGKSYGQSVYSLTGDGLVKVGERAPVPVNLVALSPGELLVWSSLINEQIQALGFDKDNVVILAAGRNYRGTIPLGTALEKGIRIGA
ncbi:hypothetical protein YDYSY3_38000 [Paenibacillus chitinolyticus]|uniref:hypothetical protein n=1 Tax=Paenibacillus chitinolyticus TaxID=79263 RepID=UPI0026E4E3BF|nr:hypothetical protein [Paenibacillus chitinolyticus]GKS12800.1 hypothetical protein YDYSY3_38000 [Paenibacillus chitinolyticus]